MSYQSTPSNGSTLASKGKRQEREGDSDVELLPEGKNFGRRNRAVAGVLLLCAVLCLVSYRSVIHATGGIYVYPLDDAYLHMSIARSFAQHGVYGLTPGMGFASASSAPLWTLLIAAGFKAFGVKIWVPFLLAALSAAFLLIACDRFLRRYMQSELERMIALSVIVIVMPVPLLIFSGMEHLLHAALSIAIASLAVHSLSKSDFSWRERSNWLLLLCIAAAVLVRFETLFLAAVLAGLALLRKRWLYGFLIATAAAIPCVVTGAISVAHGWMWLPNTVLLKAAPNQLSNSRHLLHYAFRFGLVLSGTPHLLVLFLLLSWTYVWRLRRHGFWEARQLMLCIVIAATVLHVQFAAVGWLFRYEAYLMVFSFLALFSVAGELITVRRSNVRPVDLPGYAAMAAACLAGIVLVYPIADRSSKAFAHLSLASENIYDQQFQMARFLHEFYEGKSVAANDVGAINFYADIDCVDLVGLFNLDIARKRLADTYSTSDIEREVQKHGSKIAIIYDGWFNGDMFPQVPKTWRRAGKWVVPENFILGGGAVSFYAIEPGEESALKNHLVAFSSQLPQDVTQLGEYRGNSLE